MNSYARYRKDTAAFEETDEFNHFMRVKEEADKMWEEVEASDEWKAYKATESFDRSNLKNSRLNAEIDEDHAKKALRSNPIWQSLNKEYEAKWTYESDEKENPDDAIIRALPEWQAYEEARKFRIEVAVEYQKESNAHNRVREAAEAAFLSSKIWKDWVIKKQDLLDADPKRLKLAIDYHSANEVYKRIVLEEWWTHDKAMAEFNKIIYQENNMIQDRAPGTYHATGGNYRLETPWEAFCRREKENSDE